MTTSNPSVPTKRVQSTTTIPAAKPTTKIHSLATIADRAQLLGPHTINMDAHAILHPYAKLNASNSNITIGPHCIIAEKAVVGSPDSSDDCLLAEGVSVESGAQVEGTRVGEWSTIGVGARIGRGAVVGKWCKIGPLCEVRGDEVVEDFTVVFGYGERRVDAVLRDREEVRDVRAKGRQKEVEVLAGLVPDAGAKWRG